MSLTEGYVSLNVKQLKKLLDDVQDDEREVRVWVEKLNQDGAAYLEGRRLCGVVDDPNDKYLCIVAGLYKEESE